MKTRRVQFSVKFLLVMTVAVAVLAALWVAYGAHFRFASAHLVYPEYQAASEHKFASPAIEERQIVCQIGQMRIRIPATLAEKPTVIRESATRLWLVFKDSQRNIQIPFGGREMRALMLPLPPQLGSHTVPKMIEAIMRSSSNDFSFNMSKGELAIHKWVLRQREHDAGFSNVKRFAISSTNAMDKILLSETIVNKSQRRVQSFLFWETLDFEQSGTVWFADTTNTETSWIDLVARSIEPTTPKWNDDNRNLDFSKMTDSQVIEVLCVKETEFVK